jgi:hypothetical protein
VYLELDATSDGLAEQVEEHARAYSAAGADTVVFQATGEAPDPEPLLEACGRLAGRPA